MHRGDKKSFFQKDLKKDITKDEKSILLNAMKLFDIKNTLLVCLEMVLFSL